MNIDNQTKYWNKVAYTKTFTHPVNLTLLSQLIKKDEKIVDYGCGYGRIVKQLTDLDTKSSDLIHQFK